MFEEKPPEEHLLRIDPEKPGMWALLNGAGDPVMRLIAWLGALVLPFLIVIGVLTSLQG